MVERTGRQLRLAKAFLDRQEVTGRVFYPCTSCGSGAQFSKEMYGADVRTAKGRVVTFALQKIGAPSKNGAEKPAGNLVYFSAQIVSANCLSNLPFAVCHLPIHDSLADHVAAFSDRDPSPRP